MEFLIKLGIHNKWIHSSK